MKPALKLLALLFTLAALAGCGESHSWRQKTIIEVETPNGVVSGGSMAEVSVRWFGQMEQTLAQGHGATNSIRGEASFVELAPGKYLFALTLDADSAVERALLTMRNADEPLNRSGSTKAISRRIQHVRETRAISLGQYPMLVTFDDINDPKSVKLVDPGNLAVTFGEGFKLKDIKLEITGEPVTTGKVTSVLIWLSAVGKERANLKGKPPSGLVSDQPNPQEYLVSPSDFSTELYR